MAIGKRGGVSNDPSPQPGLGGDAADSDDVIGTDGGPAMRKYGQHVGAAAHAGTVMYAGARLQGNVGDHVHYADQEQRA